MLDREINQQSTKLPPYFVFCFGITYDCVKRVQASNNTLLDKPVNGVACPSNVESEAPNMRIDIQKRNMQHIHCVCVNNVLIENVLGYRWRCVGCEVRFRRSLQITLLATNSTDKMDTNDHNWYNNTTAHN